MATSYAAGLLGLLGHKPVVPAAPKVSPQDAQSRATKGNIADLPDIEKLASEADAFSASELLKQLDRISPGLSTQLQKIPGIIADQLAGKVPEDVARSIKQTVGAQAWGKGLSPSQRASTEIGAIGKFSYQEQQEGVTSAERWMSTITSSAPLFNFTSMFITPTQEIAAEQWNEVMRFNTEWMGAKIKAMPSPTESAAAGFFNSFATLGENYISAGGFTGGFGGGAGGGPAPNRSLVNPDFGGALKGSFGGDFGAVGDY